MKPIKSFNGEYRFLSNFYLCKVKYKGIDFPSAEHAYQASKARRKPEREYISKIDTPGHAKKYGRKVKLRPDWEEIKLKVMEEIVRAKFLQNHDLAEKLLATDDAELIEGNYWGDTFWGVCAGKGENHLGRILMIVRWELL